MMMAALLIFAIHIPAGPANETLTELSLQTDIDTSWHMTQLIAVTTPAIEGRYGLYEAWCAILKGTGFTFTIRLSKIEHSPILDVDPERYPGEHAKNCSDKHEGWGPQWIHPPVADWQ
jgi:hypothetical protein